MQYATPIVTGGLGFIGSAISEHLLSHGAHVTIVDSLISNVVESDYLKDRFPQTSVSTLSVEDFFSPDRDLGRCDVVIHAASLVGPASLLTYGGQIAPAIICATAKVIDACIRQQVPLIYFSSAEIYGKSGKLSESADARVPASYNARIEYALGKLASEAMIRNSLARGLRAVVIRPFNVVGPRQSRAGGFVMPTFVQQALEGQPLTIFGSGDQQRAFTSVTDIVDFVVRYSPRAFESGVATVNLGNPHNGITIRALAERVISLLKSRSKLTFTDGATVYGPSYFEAESFLKLPDIELATSLGWSPAKHLDQIILDTADFYRAHRDARGADARLAAA